MAPAPIDPIDEFEAVFARAALAAPSDPTATALATADAAGRPSVRMVLFKGVDRSGLRFFTNYDSRKGRELAENPRAALCFYWPWIDEQVRVEGTVERLSAAESDAYFASRPRLSQLGAWASRQSRPHASRFELLRRVVTTEARFLGREVSRPPNWGGFLLRPEAVEFWASQPNRLHLRRRFERSESGWRLERLDP
ncbi:MAG: pyridoxine/pyridoxamine 5'-phosphate oxidase [Acidobacteriota bacterium]